MTEGLIEGLTGALGDELSRLGGFRSTRVQVQLTPAATVVDYGAAFNPNAETAQPWNLDPHQGAVSINAAGTTATLTVGAERGFSAAITAAHRFRILSPLLAAPSVTDSIVSRDSATQLTLGGGVFDDKDTNASWEVYDPTLIHHLNVETTFGWDTSGMFVMAGGLYRYTGTTPVQLRNVEFFNGEVWTYLLPQDLIFEVGDEVVDFTRAFSAVDSMWRSFLVDYATGTDLDTLGYNLGVRRVPTSLDAVYRAVIKAIAYVPRGTMWVIELLLAALIGEGNYEVFEDLTQRVPTAAQVAAGAHFRFSANHPAQIFIRATAASGAAGKTFVEDVERRPLLAGNTVQITETPIKVVGVELARECFERLVASGDSATGTVTATTGPGSTPTTLSVAYDAAAGLLSGEVLVGDDFHITSPGLLGRVGPISAVSGTTLTLRDIDGAAGMQLRRAWTGLAWKVTREKTGVLHGYRPSEDLQVEYEGGPLRQLWVYDGNDLGDPDTWPAAETTYVTHVTEAGQGQFLRIAEPPSVDSRAFYDMQSRVTEQSYATFELLVRINGADGADVGGSDASKPQFSMQLEDGRRLMAVGVLASGAGGDTRFGFFNPNGAVPWITSGGAVTIPSGEWTTLEIKKCRNDNVQLYADGRLVEDVPYGDFPSGGAFRRRFGNTSGPQTGILIDVKHADWSARTPRDYWNHHVATGDAADAGPNVTDTGTSGAFGSAVVGDLVRIHRHSTLNAVGGDARGEWVIDDVVDANTARTTYGRTHNDGQVIAGSLLQFRSEDDPRAFTFPTDLGNQIELVTGADAGTVWLIDQLLDPNTGRNLATLDDGTTAALVNVPTVTSVALVSPVPAGAATLTAQSRSQWRKMLTAQPAPSDPDVGFEVVDQGTLVGTTLTLPQTFPIGLYTLPDGPLVEVHYTRLLTAQVVENADVVNDTNADPGYAYYPFYLSDSFGWVKGILDVITAAGVHVDLRNFFRDASGPHIR